MTQITFSSTVFLATHSVEEFLHLALQVKKYNPQVSPAWWPVLKESYWVSAFSFESELLKLTEEVDSLGMEYEVLLDLEIPLLKPSLFLKNFFSFKSNKYRIEQLAKKTNAICAQYPRSFLTSRFLMRALGLDFATANNRVVLAYTSMMPKIFRSHVRRQIKKHLKEANNLSLGIGVLGTGVFGNEPQLTDHQLLEDLNFCDESSVKRAIIFRLGGISEKQFEILTNFADVPKQK